MSSADDLIKSIQGFNAESLANETERLRARDALFEALRRVQSPWDIAWDHVWVSGATNACIKTLIDAGVFTKWAEQGYKHITCAELAALTGAEEALLKRLMSQISGQNLVTEVGDYTYAATAWVKALATDPAFPSLYGGFYHELNNQMFRTLPSFLKQTDFKNPTDTNNCNFQFWKGPDASFFQYVGTNTALTNHFNDAMECHSRYNLTPWPDVYPTETIVAAAKSGRALVVDIGGGKGHDLEKFRLRHPDLPAGSLVLQDLPDIVKDSQPDETISVQPYDFFTPQPVHGARVYFMHNVLHDWTNDVAIRILKNVAAAMEKGYSRVLVHESLVSSSKPLARVTTSDITVMACMGARERTEAEWYELFESSGLRVIKIWRPFQSVESVIEAELA